MIDNKTQRLSLPLPNVDNYLEDDVVRLSEALEILDKKVATVGDDGKIQVEQLPAIALTDTFPVASQEEMLSLNSQPGDVAIRSDVSKSFILMQAPASVLGNWKELLNDAVVRLTPQIRESLRRSYAEAGYNLVDGSFEAGGAVATATDVLLFEANGKAYSGSGPFPQYISSGTIPSAGFIDQSNKLLAMSVIHFTRTGSFAGGGSATAGVSALLHSDGYYYTPRTGSITVAAGSSPDSLWKCVGLLNGYGINDVRNWTENLADISGNNTKLQLMADSLGAGGEIIFPAGTTTSFDKIDIKSKDFTISGCGYIDGVIRAYNGAYAVSTDLYMNFKINDECRFRTSRNLDAAIQLCYLRIAAIGFSQCDGFTHCIRKLSTSELPNPVTTGQNVNRVTVSNAKYDNCDYFIKSGTSAGVNFDAADWIITHCEGHANIDHIVFDTIDGLTVSDNIMFFPGYQAQSAVKRSHVRIENGATWVNIHDNKFFESGGTSVYLNKCARYSLHDNLYAFGAQRVPVPQIVVTGSPLSGDFFSQSTIHDETMVQCGGEGISIGAKSGRVKVHHNNIQNPSSPAYYYGAAERPAAIGIIVDIDTVAVEVCDNTTSAGTNQLAAVNNIYRSNIYRNNIIDNILPGFGIRTESTIKTMAITSGTSAIDVTAWEAVTVAVAASFGLTTIANTGQTKVITITNTGTSPFNIVHSANLKLAGSVNATLTVGSSLTLRVANGGAATEVSRAII